MLSSLRASLVNFLKNEDGPTAVEYSVMLALIIVVCITAITTLGTNANATFQAVGAQVGTVYVEPLKKTGLFAEVKIYDAIPDILRDVNTGRLKAGFADYPILAYNLQQGLFPEVRLVKTYKATVLGSIGIGVRKSDGELLKKIDGSLARLKADGTLKQILAKWGL